MTTANAETGFRTSSTIGFFPGADAQTPPLVIKVRAVPSDAIASAARTAIGVSVTTPTLNTINPSTQLNCIMLAADDTDTQMVVMHNDGAGTCTRVTLNGGTGFPANSNSTQDYSFYVKMLGGATRTATWVATNHVSNLVVTGTITGAKLPIANTGMVAFGRRGNSANTGVAPAIDFVGYAAGGFAELQSGGGGAGTWGSITGTISTQSDLLTFVDPLVAAAETVARAVAIADDRQTIAVDMTTTAAFTLAAGVGLLRGVDFLQIGTGSITLTIGATVTVNGVLGSVTPTRTLTTVQYTGSSLVKLAAADTYLLM